MSRLNFKLLAQPAGTAARATTYTTLHGPVETPVFMPVATIGAMRGPNNAQIEASGTQVLLANTYHLLLRPGIEVFRKLGGLHRFMNRKDPILTDSGGFQIFSLPGYRKMTEEGAVFRSFVDGAQVSLTPESSIEMQKAIGSDIMMVLDECVPSTVDHTEAKRAMELTHRWALRSLKARGDSQQALFGIVQGASFKDLRQQSAAFLSDQEFDGLAIGGLAVGETRAEMDDLTDWTARLLPADRPRYLMGVGTPRDILEAVHRGVDMFDCIIPNSYAQCGVAFTSVGKLQMRRPIYRLAEEALDPNCTCPTCRDFSRAYLHHLTKCGEVMGWQLLGVHNLHFYHNLMADCRQHIKAGDFADFYRTRREELLVTDNTYPAQGPGRKKSPPPETLGDYEIVASRSLKADGTPEFHSIRQISSGEVMHSVSDPVLEASRLYVEQSGLAELVSRDPAARPLVIWDVGLGAATNAMSAVRCLQSQAKLGPVRPVHLVSFEIDLDPLRLASGQQYKFPHLRHQAPLKLLAEGRWQDEKSSLTWTLIQGDFLQTMDSAPAPDLIFYDPFSFKVDSPLWKPEVFARLLALCPADGPARLFTYSAATGVRTALLSAGWFVGRGVGTGPKAETTVAASGPGAQIPLLEPEWLGRWSRSSSRYPDDLPEADRPLWDEKILAHPQFQTAEADPTRA